MCKEKFHLTFELSKDGQELQIHGNEYGLRQLCQSINRLLAATTPGHFDHDHLMTPDWGGTELTPEPTKTDTVLLHHVKVYCWKGPKPQR